MKVLLYTILFAIVLVFVQGRFFYEFYYIYTILFREIIYSIENNSGFTVECSIFWTRGSARHMNDFNVFEIFLEMR